MPSVALIDGTEVDSASREWQLECLARFVLNMPTLDLRRGFLAELSKRHGTGLYDQITTLMLAINKSRKSA